jgi:Uma2 family endonuclease
MTTLTAQPSPMPLTLNLAPVLELDDDQLFELCQRNKDLRIERTAAGEIVIMAPAGGETASYNALLTMQLGIWTRGDGTGCAFDSSGGFVLPNGALRSPDAAWVERQRLRLLSEDQRSRFLPLCPTFVLELRSPSDPLPGLEMKLQEFIDNGARLGWLVDPRTKRVHVYRPDADVLILDQPLTIAGDPELPGFVLDLTELWRPSW